MTTPNLHPFTNEPVIDFSRSIHRQTLVEALAQVKRESSMMYDLWIGGESIATDDHFVVRNPADTQMVLGRVAKGNAKHANRAVADAKKAFSQWSRTPAYDRARALWYIAAQMRRQRAELNATIILETGKQWGEADADVAEAIDFCEFYSRMMLQMSEPRTRHLPGEKNTYHYQGRGVCVVISPWNFPLAILTGMTVAPLAMGNTVIVKPAEESSLVAAKFARIVQSCDLPPGVFNFLPGLGEEVGARLVEHPDTSIINFTGSVAVGTAINEIAARVAPGQTHVKRVVAEMGGKNAIIIDDDADLDEAIQGTVASAFGYQGQKCSACSRLIVLPKVYETVLERLRNAVNSLTIGPPEDPAHQVGPVINQEAFDRLTGILDEVRKSAKVVVARDVEALSQQGYFVGPHVFADVAPDSLLGQVELFGPILAVMRASDFDEALRFANGTKYALTGGVFSRSPLHLQQAIREFEVGNLYINRKITGAEVDRQPFGGYRLSGIGAKAGGIDYLIQFAQPRTFTENTLRHGFVPEIS